MATSSRLLKKAHLLRWRARAALRRTHLSEWVPEYASRLESLAALHLGLFKQPGPKRVFQQPPSREELTRVPSAWGREAELACGKQKRGTWKERRVCFVDRASLRRYYPDQVQRVAPSSRTGTLSACSPSGRCMVLEARRLVNARRADLRPSEPSPPPSLPTRGWPASLPPQRDPAASSTSRRRRGRSSARRTRGHPPA